MNLVLPILNNIKINEKLLPVQFSVWEKLSRNNFCFAFDEIGCGKTIEAGIAIWNVIKNGGKNVLIVTSPSSRVNWRKEMLQKFGFDFKMIDNSENAVDLYINIKKFQWDQYHRIDLNHNISNFCITSCGGKNDEAADAALVRLSTFELEWDIIVLDESYDNEYELINKNTVLKRLKSKKILYLSFAAFKNLQYDFNDKLNLVTHMLKDTACEFSIENFSPEKTISFDLNYPISRSFQEITMGFSCFKTRDAIGVNYSVDDKIVMAINEKYHDLELDSKRGCLFLYDRIFREEYMDVYKIYKKPHYSKQDFCELEQFDSKFRELEKLIDSINEEKIAIFCRHREVVKYLEKMLIAKHGNDVVEAVYGDIYDQRESIGNIFNLIQKDIESIKKNIVILSHNVGFKEINLSSFSHVIYYELPHTHQNLEQQFGMADKLTNQSTCLNMYIFNDTNIFFDRIYFVRIAMKMMHDALPLLPNKNILAVTKLFQDVYIEITKQLFNIRDYMKNSEMLEEDVINISIEQIFDVKVPEEACKINKFKSDIEEKIDRFFCNLEIGSTSSIETDIRNFASKTHNTISYLNNENSKINLNFDTLSSIVHNTDFKIFCQQISDLSSEIANTIEELNEKFRELEKEKFMDFIIKTMRAQDINQNMIFSTLYGIWRCIYERPCFASFMKLYNERNC